MDIILRFALAGWLCSSWWGISNMMNTPTSKLFASKVQKTSFVAFRRPHFATKYQICDKSRIWRPKIIPNHLCRHNQLTVVFDQRHAQITPFGECKQGYSQPIMLSYSTKDMDWQLMMRALQKITCTHRQQAHVRFRYSLLHQRPCVITSPACCCPEYSLLRVKA